MNNGQKRRVIWILALPRLLLMDHLDAPLPKLFREGVGRFRWKYVARDFRG